MRFLYLDRQFKFASIDYIVKNNIGCLAVGTARSIPMYMSINIDYDGFHKVEQSQISNEDDLYICKRSNTVTINKRPNSQEDI